MLRRTMDNHAQTLTEHLRSTIWARCLTAGRRWRGSRPTAFEQFVPKGGFVCRKGEAMESWIGIIDGLVKINNFSPAGKSVTFTGVPAGGWFGEGSLLKDEPRKYDVIALRDTRVAQHAARDLRVAAGNQPAVQPLPADAAQRAARASSSAWSRPTALLDVDTRVARCLAAMFNSHLYPGLEKMVQISQEEIGYLSGASRQRANQALQLLEKEGLVRLDYGGIRVLDLKACASSRLERARRGLCRRYRSRDERNIYP